MEKEIMQNTAENAEKTADEMFEELGYEIVEIGNGTEYFLDEKEIAILINPETLKPEIWINDDFHAITMEELKAIYKKCDEMRYI